VESIEEEEEEEEEEEIQSVYHLNFLYDVLVNNWRRNYFFNFSTPLYIKCE